MSTSDAVPRKCTFSEASIREYHGNEFRSDGPVPGHRGLMGSVSICTRILAHAPDQVRVPQRQCPLQVVFLEVAEGGQWDQLECEELPRRVVERLPRSAHGVAYQASLGNCSGQSQDMGLKRSSDQKVGEYLLKGRERSHLVHVSGGSCADHRGRAAPSRHKLGAQANSKVNVGPLLVERGASGFVMVCDRFELSTKLGHIDSRRGRFEHLCYVCGQL